MKLRLKKWLNSKTNWRLFNFWIKVLTLIILIIGIWLGYNKVGEFLDIKTHSIETEKFKMIDENGNTFFEIYKEGASTTLSFPKE